MSTAGFKYFCMCEVTHLCGGLNSYDTRRFMALNAVLEGPSLCHCGAGFEVSCAQAIPVCHSFLLLPSEDGGTLQHHARLDAAMFPTMMIMD